MSTHSSVQSVSPFDLDTYLGLWFEIGRLPLRWEEANASNITAEYSLQDDGRVRIDNRCLTSSGQPKQSVGQGTVVEGEPGQLTVTFLPKALRWLPFTHGEYWVLKIDPNYTYALVGTPDLSHLWLLGRTSTIPGTVIDEYLSFAQQQGFDLEPWITTAQDGTRVTDADLADD